MKLPDAKTVNYWKTGGSSPDSWLDKAVKEIEAVDGIVTGRLIGTQRGITAVLLEFAIEGQQYRLVWPALPCEKKEEAAALRQAATFVYHDVKSKCMVAKVMGASHAFFPNQLLPDGRTAVELGTQELLEHHKFARIGHVD